MGLFETVLIVATFLCSLVAGFVFAFAVVVMPEIKNLKDGEFIRAFQVMDRVIQDNQPLFMAVWLGSALVLLAATLLGLWHLAGLDRALLIVACTLYIFGVHVPTVTINIPLNNRLQSEDIDTMTESGLQDTAALFESRWLPWNAIRTGIATLTTLLLLVLLARI